MIGGVGAVGAAGMLGAWQFGLFGSAANATTSMVVLPFENQTGDPAKKYFSDGLARELRSVLARNPRLKVAAPTSSSVEGEDEFALGRKLGVAHVLRGSVQRDTDMIRVGADLVAVKDGEVVWSETYDRVLDDVFALQSEIAQTVAVALVAEVAGASEAERAAAEQKQIGGTQNVAAYEAFLRGHALYDLSSGSESDRAALAQFDAAIAADGNYAAAHAMRSTMLASLGINLASGEGEHDQIFDDAIAAAERALAIEPRLARGHLALGYALGHGRLDSAAALPHYRAAEANAAGDADVKRAVAGFLIYGTEQARAQALIAEVLALDPLNARAFRSAGYIEVFARRYAEVIKHMERAIALNPSIASAQFGIAIARLMQGDNAGALKAAEAEPAKAFALTGAAIARHRLGDTAGAEAALAEMQRDYDGSHYQQAEVNAQIGRPAEALKWLETAYAKRDPGLLWLRNDPLLDPLRGEAQFKDLLSRLGS
jgi:TolB-like protein